MSDEVALGALGVVPDGTMTGGSHKDEGGARRIARAQGRRSPLDSAAVVV